MQDLVEQNAFSSPAVDMAEGLSREYLVQHRFCPVLIAPAGELVVRAVEQLPAGVLDDLALVYGRAVVVELADTGEVDRLIEHLTNHAERSIVMAAGEMEEGLEADVRDLAAQPPVIRYVNFLITDAHQARASDIHLEGTRSGASVRYRIDGTLRGAPEPPPGLHHAVISRIKLLAGLDVAERRRPQDGRLRIRLHQRELELRLSTVPTMGGESVVLRLLDQGGRPVSLAELGITDAVLMPTLDLVRRAHGLILVTGPTGSGKTTTLYAALQARPLGAEKVVTVEDPVEYHLPAITQVPVHRQTGVTFAAVLRHILRQDPDVIMIGEMRDEETAEIAVQAALTGHLVLATLHTNDAISAVPRLLDLGIPPYLLAATLQGILSQRLVRRICNGCGSRDTRAGAERRDTEEPGGREPCCTECGGTGYQGRTGIFELVSVTPAFRALVAREADRDELETQARADGSRTLLEDGRQKVESGITTIEEVLRVVSSS